MQSLNEKDFIAALKKGEPFEAALENGALAIKVQEWVPYLCTAIHAGSCLREDLRKKCALAKGERFQEEDPFTDKLIEYFPITVIGLDSRYEYDLNRPPEGCVHKVAWDKEVWQGDLTEAETKESFEKHASFYRILKVLIQEIIKRTGGCLILDLHSYNWQIRTYPSAPVFNLGTAQVQTKKWAKLLKTLEKSLEAIAIPNVETTVGVDVVFQGRGYHANFVRQNFPKIPLFPLEVKKVFMDEKTGEPFPLVIEALQAGLNSAVLATAGEYARQLGKKKVNVSHLTSSLIEPIVLKIDKEIYRLSNKIDTLHYVNPINFHHEKRLFFSKRDYIPSFHYRQLRVDPYAFREKLYSLPISQIQDPVLRSLYRSVVDGYAARTDMITSIGTPQFKYNSLRYYGEPSPQDIANAQFLLHASQLPSYVKEEANITPDKAKKAFEDLVKEYKIKFSVAISNRIVARAMVEPGRKMILVNSNSKLTSTHLNALLSHEFGIHALTTANASEQPLTILGIGLPGSTETQEGMAILSEYLSGNLPLSRLKLLALRVLAIKMLMEGESFRTIYQFAVDKYHLDKEEAFALTARVFRGGGFTKDYLYLSGFCKIISLSQHRTMDALMVGKTSLPFLNAIDNLIERGLLKKPTHIPRFFVQDQKKEDPVLDYLVKNLI